MATDSGVARPVAVGSAGRRPSPVVLAVGGVVVALILQAIFIASYVGALHNPQPRDLPIGIVAPSGAGDSLAGTIALSTSGQFEGTVYPDEAALRSAIARVDVYGGIVVSPTGSLLIVNQAASSTAATAVTMFGQGFAAAQGVELMTEIVHSLAAGDPRGLTEGYLMIGWVFAGYFAAVVLSTVRGTGFSGRTHVLQRLALSVGYAAACGLSGAAIVGPWFAAISGHFWGVALAGLLIVFAVTAITMALQFLLGVGGTLLVLVLFVMLGNPSSGGIVPASFLPNFWQAIGPWLPNFSAYELIRNVVYLDDASIRRPVSVLLVYAVVGVALLLVRASFGMSDRPGIDDPEAELAAAAAAG